MNKELIRKWVAALRSGEYQQGKDSLRSADTFCCLGVLCDLIDPDGWGFNEGESDIEFHYKGETYIDYLPHQLLKDHNLEAMDTEGVIRLGNHPEFNAADANDSDFDYIATQIEIRLLGDDNDS